MEEISFIVLVDGDSYEGLLRVIKGVCPGVNIASEPFEARIIGGQGERKDGTAQRLTFKAQEFQREFLSQAMVQAFAHKPKDSYALHIRSGRVF
ncbi:hypothetical protein EPO17_00110 [Patescibacteria group bacterium]|nr:MAG: hypothetical protein EPO17_00110 [Patescibacteria group bacterium]